MAALGLDDVCEDEALVIINASRQVSSDVRNSGYGRSGQHPDHHPARERKRVGLVFGEIKSYKGLDVLAEAVSLLTEPEKQRTSALASSMRP
jgi:hypothetical protein